MRPAFRLFILAIWLLGFSALVFAQPQQSENFRITKSVLDAGGGPSTSANFHLLSAFGQPTPIGVSSSTNFVLSAGFLSPVFSASPLSPIADLVIKRVPGPSPNIKLDWTAIPNADSYTIYRDTNPLFTPGPGNQIGTTNTNSYTDVGAVSLPAIRYYYIVTSTGAASGPAVIKQPVKAAQKSVTRF